MVLVSHKAVKTGQVLVKKSDKDYDFEWKYIEDIINISEIRQKLEEYDKQPLFLFWDSDGNPTMIMIITNKKKSGSLIEPLQYFNKIYLANLVLFHN